jgi:tetratricopeptide (TPR) repeat protein
LGDKNGAIRDYTKAIDIDEDYIAAYQNRGIVLRELGDEEGASADFLTVSFIIDSCS